MEWLANKGKSSTDSGAATRAPLAPGLDPGSAAARGQSAELIDADITQGFAQGVAHMQTVSPAQHAKDEARVTAEINAALERAGVPAARVVFAPRRQGGRGVFTSRNWQLTLNATMFRDPRHRLTMLGTAYHEARHAEQYFDAIRVAAGLYPDKSAARLARWIQSRGETAPPLAVIEAARQRPAQPGEGRKWFDFYFGKDAEDHRETRAWSKYRVNQVRALDAKIRRARETIRAGHPVNSREITRLQEERAQAWTQMNAAFKEYEELSDEVDADEAKKAAVKAIEAAR